MQMCFAIYIFFFHAFYSSMHVLKIMYMWLFWLALFVKAKPCLIIELKPSKCMGSLGIRPRKRNLATNIIFFPEIS